MVYQGFDREDGLWDIEAELTDVKTLIGLQWLQKWRAGLWTLDWVPSLQR